MEAPVEELIQRLEPPVDYIITSSVLTWVAEIGKRRNIPVSSLWTDSPSVFLAFHQFDSVDTDSIQDTLSGIYSVIFMHTISSFPFLILEVQHNMRLANVLFRGDR